MKTETPQTIHLADYAPPPFLIDSVALDVRFLPGEAIVAATLAVRRNPAAASDQPLCLDGHELETLAIAIDGEALPAGRYTLDADTLRIAGVPDAFTLDTTVRIRPDGNTSLSGLYRSADGYFTQCEAQGFRRITWFPDRPDVMARYHVTLHADRATLPVLLANGNPVARGDEADGGHWATWEDPFPKPCYLFALVAGKLDVLRDGYVTASGRTVQLAIYVEPGKLDQCPHAMAALKRALRWDEETFGLECDLDHYMIVAVGDFNMGAMENKGLNIFNTKYVLARPDTATDLDYENIDRVIAHEYFHNWTGNRVTCRDWFQLSLKEGLTVFRDQEFGADVHSRTVTRIRDVRTLRAAQFPEDAGPMAHPVRPASYIEINNFYTATVYEKGAEVVRMIHTLLGKDAFRRGMDLYFARHDGQAVTCDDFVAAMADASGVDLGQFKRWYAQAGTPRVAARGRYDAATRRYVLTLAQSCAPTPGQPEKPALHIPVAVGLVGPDGADLPLRLAGESVAGAGTRVLSLTAAEQEFVFADVPAAPVPSLLRGFSAPVVLEFDYTDADLTHLLAHDSDPFNRWEAGQRLAANLILGAARAIAGGAALDWPPSFAEAARRVLDGALDGTTDPAFAAEALAPQLRTAYEQLAPTAAYAPTPAEAGRRALRNLCLGYLAELDTSETRALALNQFEAADNMSDQFAALATLAQYDCPERRVALDAFHLRWRSEALVVDKWLAVQAASRLPGTPEEVRRLLAHPAFDPRNPNKVYALLATFGANHAHFHAADGNGYRFIAERIAELDALNPQVAARLARRFDRWRKFDAGRQAHARAALEGLRDKPGLSRDVFEIVDRALA